jgi:uncharacterized protein
VNNEKKDCILLFIKYPKKGMVKNRLAKDITQENAVNLYKKFVQDIISTILHIKTTLMICYYPPTSLEQFKKWLGPQYNYIAQKGDDLGQRMNNCFEEVFTKGYQKAILIGSDSPDIPKKILTNALKQLQNKDIVIGPATDGGYYLIGFNKKTFYPQIFENISWSKKTVYNKTIDIIKKTNYNLNILPLWSDIDTIDDLQEFIKRNKKTEFKTSYSITYLKKNKILIK